jgi:transcriptional regulator
MYLPSHFREDRRDVQHDLIRRHPLGMLITAGCRGLMANAVPFLLEPQAGENGTLLCHVARANPQWKELGAVDECLVVFQGADHYISPSWYPTKQETGKVVPTWNYATVHVWGRPRVIEDAAWLRAQVDALTRTHEDPRPAPWSVSDAPEPFIAAQLRGIVGVEIPIARIEGKWKVSQNRSAVDQAGVRDGLAADGAGAQDMARLVAERLSPSQTS